jgi:hypothetical protein
VQLGNEKTSQKTRFFTPLHSVQNDNLKTFAEFSTQEEKTICFFLVPKLRLGTRLEAKPCFAERRLIKLPSKAWSKHAFPSTTWERENKPFF